MCVCPRAESAMQQRDLEPNASVPAFFGAELRHYRKAAGLTQEELGERVNYTGALIGMIETTLRTPTLQLAEMCDRVLDTGGALARLWHLIGRYPDRYADLGEVEASAVCIWSIGPLLVPDLLQTPEYARAVLAMRVPRLASEQLDQAVCALVKRQTILCGRAAPDLWCVVGEAALRCPVGGREVMREQVKALLTASDSQSTVVQVVPNNVGEYVGLDGGLTLLSFEEGADIGYISGHGSEMFIEAPTQMSACRTTFLMAIATALSPARSADFLSAAMEAR
jgi:transcriptional regulator with XRE-family HTH domain